MFPPGLSRATSAATVDALHNPALLQLVLGHAADAVGREVGVSSLWAGDSRLYFHFIIGTPYLDAS